MSGYYHKIYLFLGMAFLVAAVFFMMDSQMLIRTQAMQEERNLHLGTEENAATGEMVKDGMERALVIYKKDDRVSEKYRKNLEKVLYHLRMDAETVETGRRDSVSYRDYDLVVIATGDLEQGIGADGERLMEFVKDGGRLFVGMMPEQTTGSFGALYRKFGILDYGNYVECGGIAFERELLPGIRKEVFDGEGFQDVCLSVQLDSRCEVALSGVVGESRTPMFWTVGYGGGRIGVFNGTAVAGDYWTGTAAGCITSLYDEYLYPVVNAKTVFLDDFPSPQYNSESDVIRADYNRTVREFYRDIWWPDMQAAAAGYNIRYTGLFVANYDDIVEPEKFSYIDDPTEQYFGNSLLKNGFELGAHGYNHQSLGLAGQIPKELGYRPWKDIDDMTASIRKLSDISAGMFPQVKLQSYVPPSNYLSAEGRAAAARALPELKVISGVYTDEGEEGAVYVQDFTVAEDGIAEFPRVSAGMLNTKFDRFTVANALGLYGCFSHFIHPDDILDEERGGGRRWEELSDGFCKTLELVNDSYRGIRPLTASQAAEALILKEKLQTAFSMDGELVTGKCRGFYGEAYLCLRTKKQPEMIDDTCKIQRLSGDGEGEYYLVEVLKPEFSFRLKE